MNMSLLHVKKIIYGNLCFIIEAIVETEMIVTLYPCEEKMYRFFNASSRENILGQNNCIALLDFSSEVYVLVSF